jgi:hypothetical protein
VLEAGVPENGLVRPCCREELGIMTTEKGKIRVDFENPIRLSEDDGPDIDAISSATEEWLALHPGNDIMERPGHDQRNHCGGKKPIIFWRVEEDEEAIWDCNYELSLTS